MEELSADQYRAKYVDQQEHDLQKRCVTSFRLQYPQLLLASVPNATKRNKAERGRALDEGLVSGMPDLILFYPSGEYHCLFIEMKTVKGVPSKNQLAVHAYLRSQGYAVIMPTTYEQFFEGVKNYLD